MEYFNLDECFYSEDALLKTIMRRDEFLKKIVESVGNIEKLSKLLTERKRFFTTEGVESAYRRNWQHHKAVDRRTQLLNCVYRDNLVKVLHECIEKGEVESFKLVLKFCTNRELNNARVLPAKSVFQEAFVNELIKRGIDPNLNLSFDRESVLEMIRNHRLPKESVREYLKSAIKAKDFLLISEAINHYFNTESFLIYELKTDHFTKEDVDKLLSLIHDKEAFLAKCYHYYYNSPSLEKILKKTGYQLNMIEFIESSQFQDMEFIKKYWRDDFLDDPEFVSTFLNTYKSLKGCPDKIFFFLEKIDIIDEQVPIELLSDERFIEVLIKKCSNKQEHLVRVVTNKPELTLKILHLVHEKDIVDLTKDPRVFKYLAEHFKDQVQVFLADLLIGKRKSKQKIRDL